jgi:hypothetical protein
MTTTQKQTPGSRMQETLALKAATDKWLARCTGLTTPKVLIPVKIPGSRK